MGTYLDASFDQDSQEMMDMMSEAVEASLDEMKKSKKELKRPAGYEGFKKKAKNYAKKPKFGFDEEDFTDSDESDEEILQSKRVSSLENKQTEPANDSDDVKVPSNDNSGKISSEDDAPKVEATSEVPKADEDVVELVDLTHKKPCKEREFKMKMQ